MAKKTTANSLQHLKKERENWKTLFEMELDSMKKQKELWVQELCEIRDTFLKEREKVCATMEKEWFQKDHEIELKEKIFDEHCSEKENFLTQQTTLLRKEIAQWISLKEDICNKTNELNRIHEYLRDLNAEQKRERRWLLEKQKVGSKENDRCCISDVRK